MCCCSKARPFASSAVREKTSLRSTETPLRLAQAMPSGGRNADKYDPSNSEGTYVRSVRKEQRVRVESSRHASGQGEDKWRLGASWEDSGTDHTVTFDRDARRCPKILTIFFRTRTCLACVCTRLLHFFRSSTHLVLQKLLHMSARGC